MTRTTSFTAEHLADALDSLGVDDADVRTDYSGRGMYGDRCFGVVCDRPDGIVGLVIVQACINAGQDAYDAVRDAAEIVGRSSSDSMGRSGIVYFPGWELAADEEG